MAKSQLLIAATLIVVMVLLAGGMGLYVLSDPMLPGASSLVAAADVINFAYHSEVDWDKIGSGGVEGLLGLLDRFSGYVSEADFRQMREDQSGGYSGLGITIVARDSGLLVLDVRQEGPAFKAGLLPGDCIVRADSTSLIGRNADEASALLRGPEGTTVALRIFRAATADTLEVTLTRGRVPFQHIPYAGITSDSLLYVRLEDFGPGAAADVQAALDSLLTDSRARGVILDLRGNPGGLLTEAYGVANLLLKAGAEIVGTDGRSRWDDEVFVASDTDHTGGLPMAVLVDGGSASAAEIVAGAMQQLGRATLVSDTSYGKGLVQGYYRFTDGDGLRLTISRYFLYGGKYLNDVGPSRSDTGRGLVPDHIFAGAEVQAFPAAVERSLLLHQFAFRYQDEILRDAAAGGLGMTWVAKFRDFAVSNGFQFESELTGQALWAREAGQADLVGTGTMAMLDRLIRQAREHDLKLFEKYADWLTMRLLAIATQRRHSTYVAYRDVIIPRSDIVQFCSALLRQADTRPVLNQ